MKLKDLIWKDSFHKVAVISVIINLLVLYFFTSFKLQTPMDIFLTSISILIIGIVLAKLFSYFRWDKAYQYFLLGFLISVVYNFGGQALGLFSVDTINSLIAGVQLGVITLIVSWMVKK